jgi:L-proline amide hydrolase
LRWNAGEFTDMVREATSTGSVPFMGYETWYRVTGDLRTSMTPLVVVHGGPGFTHDYVLSLSELAATGRPVVHYDQLGCGRSTRLPDRGGDFWTVSLFLEELDNLLNALGIEEDYHLLGQSWGGMLGAEHALRQPAGLRSLILSNSPASESVLLDEAHRLRRDLPADVQAVLDHHEALGTIDDPAYLAATQAFYDRHICQVLPYPTEVQASFDAVAADSTVYGAMIGPNEMYCTGTLRDWSVIGTLGTIVAPTLLLSGRYDEATPATVQPFADEIADVTWTVFEHSSHMPFVEEPEAYFSVVSDFLARHDDRGAQGTR